MALGAILRGKDMDKTLTWSYGGGVQSIAIALLVAQRKLPKPDIIVFADTGLEASETWEYTEQYVSPLLASLGLQIEIASHELAKVGMYDKHGTTLIPAYTAEKGKLKTYCSKEWKTYVVRRYLRSKGVKECIAWLGMSTDEIERLKPSDVKWQETVWPLCGLPREYDYGVRFNRMDCRQLILNHGWPEPPKSSCYICPHRRNPQWQRLKMYYPQDFNKAVVLDKAMREKDTKGGVWLHENRKPLDEIDFSKPDSQPELFGCDSGFCWT